MNSTNTNRQTIRSSVSDDAARAFPDLVTLGFVRVTPGSSNEPARARRRRTTKTTPTTLDEMPGVMRRQPVDNNLLAQLQEMLRKSRTQRLQSMAQSGRRIRTKTTPALSSTTPLRMIQPLSRYRNSKRRFVYSNPSGQQSTYPAFVKRALTDAWSKLPVEFQRGCKATIGYDFMDRTNHEEGKIPKPAWVRPGHGIAEYYDTDGKWEKDVILDKEYWGHTMTMLEDDLMEEEEAVTRSLSDLLERGKNHIHNRSVLQELYAEYDLSHNHNVPIYRQPVHLLISFWKLKFDEQETIGDKTSWLLGDILH